MSLLDSILGSMNRPKPAPKLLQTQNNSNQASSSTSTSPQSQAAAAIRAANEKSSNDVLERFRQEQAMIQKRDREQKQALLEKVKAEIAAFMANPELKKLECPTMDQVKRAVVHSVADELGLISHSFGEEGVDRHIVLYKPEFAPTSDELDELKDPDGFRIRKEAQAKMDELAKNPPKIRRRRPASELDNSLIHQVEVVKRDTRTIEELQAVIKANKTSQKTLNETEGSHDTKRTRVDNDSKSDDNNDDNNDDDDDDDDDDDYNNNNDDDDIDDQNENVYNDHDDSTDSENE